MGDRPEEAPAALFFLLGREIHVPHHTPGPGRFFSASV
jgi:hypothetical protein